MGLRAWRPPILWAIGITVFLIAGWWFVSHRTWLARALALGTWFLFGAFLIQIRGRPVEDPHLAAFSNGQAVTLTAHVIREGYGHSAAASPRFITQSIDVETETVQIDGGNENESWPVRTGIRLSLYEHGEYPAASANGSGGDRDADSRDTRESVNRAGGSALSPSVASSIPSPDFRYGERLLIRAKLHPPRNFHNAGAFDYEGYLRDSGIGLLGSAPMTNVERLPGFSGSRIMLRRARVQRRQRGSRPRSLPDGSGAT